MKRLGRRLALAALAFSLPASAIQPLRARPPGELVKARLPARHDATRTRVDGVAGPEALAALAPDAREQLAEMRWESLADRGSGRPLRVWGAPVSAAGETLRERALAFADAHPALIGFVRGRDGYALDVAGEPFRAGPVTVVRLAQRWHGIPVEGVHADVRFRDGAAVMARLHLARGIDAATEPVVTQVQALSFARAAVAQTGRTPSSEPRPAAEPLAIVRRGDGWRLAWAVTLESVAPRGRLMVWIDALDGEALFLRDDIRRGAVDTPLTLRVSYEPRKAGDAEVIAPLPFFHARDSQGTFVGDTSGTMTVPVSGASRVLDLPMEGDFVRVTLWDSTTLAATVVDSGVPETFTWDEQSASFSERDAAFSHARVRARMKVMAPDLAFPDEQIGIVVDIPDSDGCNAFWDGNSAEFYAESEICNATARLADVVYHEIGHGFHGALAESAVVPGDVGEGSADYLAATINSDPDIAPGFYKAQPEGLRNLEPDLVFPDDLTDEIHHDGQIWGGAFWDLRTALVATLGTDLGVATADTIFTETLRFNPVMEDGFYDALLAADDDGNVLNGGPNECAVVAAFGAHGLGPGNGLAIAHLPLGVQAPGGGVGFRVRAHIASAFPRCGATGVAGAVLQWRLAGESAWRSLEMGADLVPGWRVAVIPPQDPGAIVEYRMSAAGANGDPATAPARFFDEEPFRFRVGAEETVFEDDFETDLGWTHVLLEGNDILGADDWQRGTPRGRAGDPHYAFSGSNVWGNDLGEDPFNGAYQPAIRNRLESPVIDCRECGGTRLQFRRWIGVEEAAYDTASVWVNGERVWVNSDLGRTRDREWRFEDVDISRVADGTTFRIRFELRSDVGLNLGGWNIDDVRVVRAGEFPGGGACACSFGNTRGPARGAVTMALLVLGGALLRRTARRFA